MLKGAQASPKALAAAAVLGEHREVGITLMGEDRFGQEYRFEIVNDPSGLFEVVGDDQLIAPAGSIDSSLDYPIVLGAVDSTGARATFDITVSGEHLVGSVIDTPQEAVISIEGTEMNFGTLEHHALDHHQGDHS